MASRLMQGALLLSALAAPCSAAAKGVPPVAGGSLGVDSYVQEFQAAMQQADAELAAIKTAILAVQVPQGTKAGALAAGVKAAGEYAAVGAVVLRAEKAHAKFLAHVMGFDPSDDLDIKLNLKAPAFTEKRDANLRPKADPTLKGAKAPGGAGSSDQKLAAVSSRFSYASSVGPVGSGFEAETAGLSLGKTDAAAGMGTAAADIAPPTGPGAKALSSNSSTVAEGALQRAQERQRAAEQAAQERRQEKDQRNQQMAQMAQQLLGQAAQALGKTEESAGGCKNCNKKKQQESQQAAAAAPT